MARYHHTKYEKQRMVVISNSKLLAVFKVRIPHKIAYEYTLNLKSTSNTDEQIDIHLKHDLVFVLQQLNGITNLINTFASSSCMVLFLLLKSFK